MARQHPHFQKSYLRPDGLELAEVSVVAQRPFIERRADRMIVNVENSILAAGSNALEVLERAPGIVVSAGESISITWQIRCDLYD